MNAANATHLLRLLPPTTCAGGYWSPTAPTPPASELCAHVWLAARNFFTRESARQFCWLWALGVDGRVHALRVPATRAGDDHFARSLLARFVAEPDLPIPAARASRPVSIASCREDTDWMTLIEDRDDGLAGGVDDRRLLVEPRGRRAAAA